ncbi:MAG: type II toxin-antitoxin system Phd/YefM family antitoxin [Reichenbachiella sp.]
MVQSINLVEDICPISEFRANSNSLLKNLKECHRPLVLTQNGRSSAVLIDVNDYQEMKDQLELLQEIASSQKQIADGKGVIHSKAKKQILKKFK